MGYDSEPAWDASDRRQNQFEMEEQERISQQLALGQRVPPRQPQPQESWGFAAEVNEEEDEPSMLGREKEDEFQQDFELAADEAAAFEDGPWSSNKATQNDFREDNMNPTADTNEEEFSPHDIVIQFFNSPGDSDDAALQKLDWNDRDFLKVQ